ncbi:helix-turn-helix transcriptional regulator [Dyadobacter psychrotolerans]|uniref:HTH luxR-type domain-containing protein n=1 Tax=Dyadobacter psychrotolerans TaxID=2541721 RepID=A0A4R5DP18_9BACT|nr:hypothetical protein E0F88_22535 [Dyadobacter psychrotolerans]
MNNNHDVNKGLSVGALNSLTQAEWKVLLLIAADSPNSEIAQVLSIEIKSVRNYRTRIGDKLCMKGYFVLGAVARRHRDQLNKLYTDWYKAS